MPSSRVPCLVRPTRPRKKGYEHAKRGARGWGFRLEKRVVEKRSKERDEEVGGRGWPSPGDQGENKREGRYETSRPRRLLRIRLSSGWTLFLSTLAPFVFCFSPVSILALEISPAPIFYAVRSNPRGHPLPLPRNHLLRHNAARNLSKQSLGALGDGINFSLVAPAAFGAGPAPYRSEEACSTTDRQPV